MAFLTIFTPAYNRANTLPRTYESLCRQDCKDFIWLIVDDGSTDQTAELVRGWQKKETGFEIQYIYKENGGMHTAHNAAYENIHTELNVCIDSDDRMAPGAVAKIKSTWEKVREKGYAGLIALDSDFDGNIIGKSFPEGMTDTTLGGYYAAGGAGDKKLIYRTDVINSVPPYPVFEGEKYVGLVYKYTLIDQQYKLYVLNDIICEVEYQADGSTGTMWKQYLKNPNGFAFLRKIAMQYPTSKRRLVQDCIHYCSSSQIAKNRYYIQESPRKLLTVLCTPLGWVLTAIIRKKQKEVDRRTNPGDNLDRQTDRQIAVIIPVYNCRQYLSEAVHSVLSQRLRHVEVLLVDDGSTDGSGVLCDEIADDYKNVYALHQANGGVSSARNKGIEYIISRKADISNWYIAFLDADDIWAADFFSEDILELLEKDYDILGFTSARCNYDLSRRAQEVCVKEGDFQGGANCMKARSEHFASMLYSARLIRDYNVRFVNDLMYGEDLIFRYECLYLCGKLHIEQKLLYCYRENRGSAVYNRKYGLDYFIPLLNGYLAMDSDMEQWADERRGTCSVGRGIADFYIKDMVDEHLMHFGSVQDIVNAEQNYPEIFNGHNLKKEITDRSFWLKRIVPNYAKGVIIKITEIFRRNYRVQILLERVKYPIRFENRKVCSNYDS